MAPEVTVVGAASAFSSAASAVLTVETVWASRALRAASSAARSRSRKGESVVMAPPCRAPASSAPRYPHDGEVPEH